MPADDHQDQIRTDGPAGASLGFGVPAAIRRRSAEPDRPMVAVSGDGAFRYAAPALWSAARYEEGLTAVVLRNHRIELPVGGCAGSHR